LAADKAYFILLTCALGLSVGILFLSRILSGDPIVRKETIKLQRLRLLGEYESLPTHVQNGNGTHVQNGNGIGHAYNNKKTKSPEPLAGWRLRMGILHTAVIASLVAIHVVILITDGVTPLRIAFVVYWVLIFRALVLTSGCHSGIQRASISSDVVPTVPVQFSLCAWRVAPGLPCPNGCLSTTSHPTKCHILSIRTLRLGVCYHCLIDRCRQHYSVLPALVPTNNRLFTPRVFRPVVPEDNCKPSPIQTCTPISAYLTFFYIDYLIRKGIWQELVLDDLPPLPDDYHAKLWSQKYVDSKYIRTLWRILSITKTSVVWMVFWSVFETVLTIAPTLVMNRLLAYLENPALATVTPYVWVVALLVLPILVSICFQQYFVHSITLTAHVKAALVQALYEKTLKVRMAGAPEGHEEVERNRFGRINNLMSSDM
jgi:hypothetical protein